MTNNNFVLYSIENAPAASASILTAVQNAWGFVPNLHKVMAASPAAIEAYSSLWTLAERTSFSAVERNIAYLAIIYENECDYCMAGHTNLSKMAGVDAEHITAIREGKVIADTKLEALRQFAALITKNRGFVTEQQVEAFKAAGYSNESVLDLLVLAATKLLSNYTNHLARTPLDSFMKGAEWQLPAAK
jgi:uncharacterized peroxidase-related enzyme